jgi:hypothetical protein
MRRFELDNVQEYWAAHCEKINDTNGERLPEVLFFAPEWPNSPYVRIPFRNRPDKKIVAFGGYPKNWKLVDPWASPSLVLEESGSAIMNKRGCIGECRIIIYRPEEIEEIESWHFNAGDDIDEKIQWKTAQLSKLIEGIYVVIEDPLEDPFLVALDRVLINKNDETIPGELHKDLLDCHQCNSYTEILEHGDEGFSPDASLRDRIYTMAINGEYGVKTSLHPSDLIFGGFLGFVSPSMLRSFPPENEYYSSDTVKLVIRPDPKNASSTFLHDFFLKSTEGSDGLQKVLKAGANWRTAAKEINVEMPNSIKSQIRWVLERRAAEKDFIDTVDLSIAWDHNPVRECVSKYKNLQIIAETQFRWYAKYRELSRPDLPFVIEYPLHRYKRAKMNDLERVKYGQMILNVIARTLLFLPLEELSGSANPNVENVRRLLTEKPLSDGAIVDLWSQLASGTQPGDCPIIGDKILGVSRKMKRDLFDPWIKARNQMHHGEYDAENFLESCEEIVPKVEQELRGLFSDYSFLVPLSYASKDGMKSIRARSLMGAHTDFPEREYKVSTGFDRFPCEEVVLVQGFPLKKSLPLTGYFKGGWRTRRAYDVALFEKQVKGEPSFQWMGDS